MVEFPQGAYVLSEYVKELLPFVFRQVLEVVEVQHEDGDLWEVGGWVSGWTLLVHLSAVHPPIQPTQSATHPPTHSKRTGSPVALTVAW